MDAPAGSRLGAWFRESDSPRGSWSAWVRDREVDGGDYELCLPATALNGSGFVRVRVGVRTPEGHQTFAHTPDTLVVIDRAADCTPSDTMCCPERSDAAVAGSGTDAGVAVDAAVARSSDASAPTRTSAPPRSADASMPTDPLPPEQAPSGCAVHGAPAQDDLAFTAIAVAFALPLLRKGLGSYS